MSNSSFQLSDFELDISQSSSDPENQVSQNFDDNDTQESFEISQNFDDIDTQENEEVPAEQVPEKSEKAFSLNNVILSDDEYISSEEEDDPNKYKEAKSRQEIPETITTDLSEESSSQNVVPKITFDFTPKRINPILTKKSNFDNYNSKIKTQPRPKIKTKSKKVGFKKIDLNNNLNKVSAYKVKQMKNCMKMLSNQQKKKANNKKMPKCNKIASQLDSTLKIRNLETERLQKLLDKENQEQIQFLEECMAQIESKFKILEELEESERNFSQMQEQAEEFEDELDDDVIERWAKEIDFLNEEDQEEIKQIFEADVDNHLLKNDVDNWKFLLEMAEMREENAKKQLEDQEAVLNELQSEERAKERGNEWMERLQGLLQGMLEKIEKKIIK